MNRLKSQRMLELIDSYPGLCKALANYKIEFRDMLYQIQMDSVTRENSDSIAPVIIALKNIHTVFDEVIIAGEAFIAKEEKQKKN